MILVSAGHHALAKGATWQNWNEYDEAKTWRDDIVHTLEHHAAPVPSGLLRDKVKFINQVDPALAIEIHFNSAKNMRGHHVGSGCESLYKPEDHRSRHAAQQLQMAMAEVFQPSRGAKEGWYRMDFPGRVDYHGDVDGDEKIDYFLRATNCPAVILEPEFIHRMKIVHTGKGLCCLAICNALFHLMKDWDVI